MGHGEHLGNRVQARYVSPLLNPPFSPPAHLYLLPPSPLLHVALWTLWVSLTVENLFTINLEVLLSVLYGERSLEATERIRLNPEARGLSPKPENTRELLTTGNIK